MVERLLVVGVTFFKSGLAQTDVFLGCVVWFWCADCCFVYDVFGEALLLHRAVFFPDAVACFLLRFVVFLVQDFPIERTGDGFDVRHTTVAHFHRIFVKDNFGIWNFWENVFVLGRESFFRCWWRCFYQKVDYTR